MSEPIDIARMREALKGTARFRELPEGRKAKLFQGMGKIREWLSDDVVAEDFSNRNSLKRDKESLIGPLKRILPILHAHREISIDLIDGLSRLEQTGLGKVDSAAAVAELDAFRQTARRLLAILERDEPSRLVSILIDRDGRLEIADPPAELSEKLNPEVGLPIVRGYKPGRSQRKKVELVMVHELLAEVFEGISEAEANELAAAITGYTRAEGSRHGKPVTPAAIKKQKLRRRRG
jgi:hypothetical protein